MSEADGTSAHDDVPARRDVISSRTVVWYKTVYLVVFPVLGLLAIVAMLFAGAACPFLLGAAIGLPLVYGFCYFFLIDLADEVVDLGNRVRVRRGGKVEEVLLDNVRSVQFDLSSNPSRVVLWLSRGSRRFGDRVTFIPRSDPHLNLLRENQVVADLKSRVARRAHPR